MFINNKIVSSVFIIMGTAIGGSMVAMPLALSGVGFIVSIVILIIMCLVLNYAALLVVELYQYHSPDTTLTQMAEYYLGKSGRNILAISMFILMFSLIAAYISGSGEWLHVIGKYFGLDYLNYVYSAFMTGVLMVLLVLGTRQIDIFNQCLFMLKMTLLLIILLSMFSFVNLDNLSNMPENSLIILNSLPIIATVFGFHTCIQSLEIYLVGNHQKIRKAILISSGILLIVNILWILVIFGSLDSASIEAIKDGGNANSVSLVMSQLLKNPHIEIGIKIFNLLAILTSFVGVSLGMFDYVSTSLQLNKKLLDRFFSALITFFIPVLFVIFYPNGFLLALKGAAIAMGMMTLIIPTLMVWKARNIVHKTNGFYRVSGGKTVLILTFMSGCLISATALYTFVKDLGS